VLRAELIGKDKLEEALATQQRTLKRLGDILIESGAVTKARFAQMMRLQTTETLYKLFAWKNGSYEFSQETWTLPGAPSIPSGRERPARGLPADGRVAGPQEEDPVERRHLREAQGAGGGGLPATGEISRTAKATRANPPPAQARLQARDGGQDRAADRGRLPTGEFEALKALQQLIEWNT